MSTNEQYQYAELQSLKLDIRTKLVRMNILKQLEAILNCIRGTLTPSRSHIENTYKLVLVGMFLVFCFLVVVVIKVAAPPIS